jgi:hypothetical protein
MCALVHRNPDFTDNQPPQQKTTQQKDTMRRPSSNKQIDIEKLALNRFRRASIDPSKAALRTLMTRLLEPAQAAINLALDKWDDNALWKMCQDAKSADQLGAAEKTNSEAGKKPASQKGPQ